jgi:hypothetical protein
MKLREWVTDAIREGGTIKWTIGLLIKLIFEGVAAICLGFLLAKIVLTIFPASQVRLYLKVKTFSAVWATCTVSLFWKFTLCTYTQSLQSS